MLVNVFFKTDHLGTERFSIPKRAEIAKAGMAQLRELFPDEALNFVVNETSCSVMVNGPDEKIVPLQQYMGQHPEIGECEADVPNTWKWAK